ncbi:hypothetical protein BC834DRAFT_179056 [Gloeopeniophorella convolvens]|nr:hypothetical protein BC834DRAFT_179056 [Gloeopeniophorella convolvens]
MVHSAISLPCRCAAIPRCPPSPRHRGIPRSALAHPVSSNAPEHDKYSNTRADPFSNSARTQEPASPTGRTSTHNHARLGWFWLGDPPALIPHRGATRTSRAHAPPRCMVHCCRAAAGGARRSAPRAPRCRRAQRTYIRARADLCTHLYDEMRIRRWASARTMLLRWQQEPGAGCIARAGAVSDSGGGAARGRARGGLFLRPRDAPAQQIPRAPRVPRRTCMHSRYIYSNKATVRGVTGNGPRSPSI